MNSSFLPLGGNRQTDGFEHRSANVSKPPDRNPGTVPPKYGEFPCPGRGEDALMARVLEWVVSQVASAEGAAPASLAVTHPANWGQFKLDVLRRAVGDLGLRPDHMVPEPVAAASFYASQRGLPPGGAVAVYDLGGGTFDAAVVRADPAGYRIVGRPDGIERLGGVDFDYAVLRHVTSSVGVDLDELDLSDAEMAAGLVQLRDECVRAKEALSAENDVAIPVMLPGLHTQVRPTRTELETMVRPGLEETLAALDRTIGSTGLAPDDIHAVLLVGGSSRIPFVAQLVAGEMGRPVAVDARPKDAICLGAALVAANAAAATAQARAPVPAGSEPGPPSSASLVAGGSVAAAPSVVAGPPVAPGQPSAVAPRRRPAPRRPWPRPLRPRTRPARVAVSRSRWSQGAHGRRPAAALCGSAWRCWWSLPSWGRSSSSATREAKATPEVQAAMASPWSAAVRAPEVPGSWTTIWCCSNAATRPFAAGGRRTITWEASA